MFVFPSQFEGFGLPRRVKAQTGNVSLEGLSIELHEIESSLSLTSYLASNKKGVALDMKIPPKGERTTAAGNVVWYDELGSREESYYLTAGIVLKEMEIEDRVKWIDFVRNITKKHGIGTRSRT